MSHRVFRHLGYEHAAVLAGYMLLSIGLTWPLFQNFTSAITGSGDAKHHLWMLWHTKEALLGRDAFFSTSLLYYPKGVTLLVNALGPLTGLFALPFWTWGPEAANNGTILVSFCLTGYGMYLLARGLKFEPPVAFFTGVILLSAPIHLAALWGHLPKLFIGLPPLALLMLHFAFDLQRSKWWALAFAITMLLILLHSGEQFVFTAFAVGFFMLTNLFLVESTRRQSVLQRIALVSICSAVLTVPILWAILDAPSRSGIRVERNLESFNYQPDLIQFFVPGWPARVLGPTFANFLSPYVRAGIETAVFLSWIGILLCVFALLSRNKLARPWLVFTILSILIALGPDLKILNQNRFTSYQLPIIMPYAFLTSLPGMEFWRTPGRFMLVGFVTFGIAAGYGLSWLTKKTPMTLRLPLVVGAIVLVVVENWPEHPPQTILPPVPQFYKQISQDVEQYGVFDLPIRPHQEIGFSTWYVYYSSYYQMFQMTHGKGIATGYIARPFAIHPVFGHFVSNFINESPFQNNVFVNGKPANRYASAEYELARNNYRYVVYHKPRGQSPPNFVGSWGDIAARRFIEQVFDGQKPFFEDEWSVVYRVSSLSDAAQRITTTIVPRDSEFQNWLEFSTGQQWILSPAEFYVASPQTELAYLEVTPTSIRDICSNSPLTQVVVTLYSASAIAQSQMVVGQTTKLPFFLLSGSQVITLTLEAQNHPSSPMRGAQCLGFTLPSLNLATSGQSFPPDDLIVDGQIQLGGNPIVAVHGEGWYGLESDGGIKWRWAQSPSEVLIYSPSSRLVQLEAVPVALYDPAYSNGKGKRGKMQIAVEDEMPQEFNIEVNQLFVAPLQLRRGWNRVVLSLLSGNFKPCDVEAGNGDERSLSFAFARINIATQ